MKAYRSLKSLQKVKIYRSLKSLQKDVVSGKLESQQDIIISFYGQIFANIQAPNIFISSSIRKKINKDAAEIILYGNITTNGNFFVNNDVKINGYVTVLGDIKFNKNTYVQKDIYCKNKLFVNQELIAENDIKIHGDIENNGRIESIHGKIYKFGKLYEPENKPKKINSSAQLRKYVKKTSKKSTDKPKNPYMKKFWINIVWGITTVSILGIIYYIMR
jgi:cytoskeletal protein CcmA (bactofilin family)